MTLDNEVERLKILRGNRQNEHLRLQRDIESTYPNEITRLEKRIEEKTADIDTIKASKNADFSMKVDGKTYTERTDAGDALSGRECGGGQSSPVSSLWVVCLL
jgi:hypothetical protein